MKSLKIILVFFFFVSVSSCVSDSKKNREFILPDGVYEICLKENQHNSIQTVYVPEYFYYKTMFIKSENQPGLQWKIKHLDRHYYEIQSMESNQLLTIDEYPGSESGYKLITDKPREDDSQVWIIHKYDDERFKISSKLTYQCLFVKWVEAESIPIDLHTCNNKTNEFWNFREITD